MGVGSIAFGESFIRGIAHGKEWGVRGLGLLALVTSVYSEPTSLDPHQHTNLGFTPNARINGTSTPYGIGARIALAGAGAEAGAIAGAGVALMEAVL